MWPYSSSHCRVYPPTPWLWILLIIRVGQWDADKWATNRCLKCACMVVLYSAIIMRRTSLLAFWSKKDETPMEKNQVRASCAHGLLRDALQLTGNEEAGKTLYPYLRPPGSQRPQATRAGGGRSSGQRSFDSSEGPGTGGKRESWTPTVAGEETLPMGKGDPRESGQGTKRICFNGFLRVCPSPLGIL